MNPPKSLAFSAIALTTVGIAVPTARAVTLMSIEFKENDQAGFDLWPSAFTGSVTTANFATPTTGSGSTTVTITASSTLGQALNRGTISDGTPAGFTYSNLYRDLLIASGPTGFLTLEFSGLDANTAYDFTLYAWDPGDTSNQVREWSVIGGSGAPASNTLNWGTTALVDNDTFSMKFAITTDGSGAFSLRDTGALQGSAINGFVLSQVPEPSSTFLSALGVLALLARRRR